MAKRGQSKPDRRPVPPRPVRRAPVPPPAPRMPVVAAIVSIVVATSVAYLPSLTGGFIFDDGYALTNNLNVKAPDGLFRIWNIIGSRDPWPVTDTSFWLEWRLWGMHPTGYRVTNLILHIVAALLIWRILLRVSIPGAWLAALLFAVHPVNVESVAWIAQRKGLLAMVFFLLSILWYAKAETPSSSRHRDALAPARHWYWSSLAAFVLAMLSKGSVAMLPLILLGLVAWLRPLTRRDVARTIPFFLVTAVLVAVNIWVQSSSARSEIRHAGFGERLLGAAAVVWFYLYKAILPVDLAFIYPQWHIDVDRGWWYLPLLAATALTGVLWHFRRRWSRPVLFAWGYFCVALAPVMGFTDVHFMQYTLVADHYQHLALIGVLALVAGAWAQWQRRVEGPARHLPAACAVIVGGVCTLLTWQQSRLYADGITLFQATVRENPDSWLVHNNLGVALAEAGRLQEAIDHYEQAVKLNADYAEAQVNMGHALYDSGRFPEAIERYEQVLRLHPDIADAHNNLGAALQATGRLEEAIEQYSDALRLKPAFPEAHNNLGRALLESGRLADAIAHFEQALRLNPDFAQAHDSLGDALAQTGRLQDAVDQYEHELRLTPESAATENKLGSVLGRTGRLAEATAHIERALRLEPDYPQAHNNMGNILALSGRIDQAIAHFEEALRLQPDYREARNNLALAMKRKAAQPAETP